MHYATASTLVHYATASTDGGSGGGGLATSLKIRNGAQLTY